MMARPLRIEFPGGLHHITSCDDRREVIFFAMLAGTMGLVCCTQVCACHNWLCHTYCLMGNHFHSVVKTIDGNLSDGVRQLKRRLYRVAQLHSQQKWDEHPVPTKPSLGRDG